MRPPQTRTTPAAKTITCEEPLSAPFDHETASIPKMIARLRFLEADCRYHTAICEPVAKSVALNIRHSEERAEIMQRLAKTVPDRLTRWSFSTSPRSGTQKTPDLVRDQGQHLWHS